MDHNVGNSCGFSSKGSRAAPGFIEFHRLVRSCQVSLGQALPDVRRLSHVAAPEVHLQSLQETLGPADSEPLPKPRFHPIYLQTERERDGERWTETERDRETEGGEVER